MERFLCDEMLARLCRYLRAAGYDAALASDGIRDRVLLQQCQAEARRFLTLDRRICIDDGGQYAELNNRFNRVQLFSGSGRLNARLRAAVGHRVRITGDGFAAQTGHHHADLMVDLRTLAVVRR